jgi:hypothetical protein
LTAKGKEKTMASKIFLFGIVVMILLFGMTFIGCENVDKNLNGTWLSDNGSDTKMEYQDGDFELKISGIPFIKGTYTTKGNKITTTGTHYGNFALVYGLGYSMDRFPSNWFTRDELSFFYSEDLDSDDYFSDIFGAKTGTYSVIGDTLTETWEGETTTSTRISSNTEITKLDKNNPVVTGSDNNQALVGRWIEIVSGDQIDLLSDGTGIFDRQSVTWKIEANRLYVLAVSSFRESGSFEYKVSGSVLVLSSDGRSETYVKR